MGGSFGGYMANWIGGCTDRFRCIVTHASIFDFSAFYGTTDFPPWWVLEFGVSPYEDPERTTGTRRTATLADGARRRS